MKIWEEIREQGASALRVAAYLLILVALFWVLNYINNGLFNPKDSTDPEIGRSGMGLHIDNATGCHYLNGGMLSGALTPRLAPDGSHICTGHDGEAELKKAPYLRTTTP